VQSQHLVKNRILRQLSADELKSIQPWFTVVKLQSNTVVHETGAAIGHIYFPLSGMISLLAVMQSGEAIETGIIGVMACSEAAQSPTGISWGKRWCKSTLLL